jgi:hypothetical protein
MSLRFQDHSGDDKLMHRSQWALIPSV